MKYILWDVQIDPEILLEWVEVEDEIDQFTTNDKYNENTGWYPTIAAAIRAAKAKTIGVSPNQQPKGMSLSTAMSIRETLNLMLKSLR